MSARRTQSPSPLTERLRHHHDLQDRDERQRHQRRAHRRQHLDAVQVHQGAVGRARAGHPRLERRRPNRREARADFAGERERRRRTVGGQRVRQARADQHGERVARQRDVLAGAGVAAAAHVAQSLQWMEAD